MKRTFIGMFVTAIVVAPVAGEFNFAGDAGIPGVKNIGEAVSGKNADVLRGRVNF